MLREEIMSWATKAWELLWPRDDLPRLIALEEMGPIESPSVPSSLPAEFLDRDWPEPEVSCMQSCGVCGSSNQAPSLLSSRAMKPMSKPPVTFVRKAKTALSDTTVQAEPIVRPPAACSRVKDRTAPAEDDLCCSRWCGTHCAAHFNEVSLLLTRPTFGRPPAHAGSGSPQDQDLRPTDDSSPAPDARLDDTGDSNRQTSRPKFWWKDLEDEEGLEQLVRQIHMPEETFSLVQPKAQAPDTTPEPLADESPEESQLLIPPSPALTLPTPPTHNSHYSLNSILHKPGTRSPSVDQHVTFTVSPDPPKSPETNVPGRRNVNPISKRGKSVPPRPRSDAVLWHLIPGS